MDDLSFYSTLACLALIPAALYWLQRHDRRTSTLSSGLVDGSSGPQQGHHQQSVVVLLYDGHHGQREPSMISKLKTRLEASKFRVLPIALTRSRPDETRVSLEEQVIWLLESIQLELSSLGQQDRELKLHACVDFQGEADGAADGAHHQGLPPNGTELAHLLERDVEGAGSLMVLGSDLERLRDTLFKRAALLMALQELAPDLRLVIVRDEAQPDEEADSRDDQLFRLGRAFDQTLVQFLRGHAHKRGRVIQVLLESGPQRQLVKLAGRMLRWALAELRANFLGDTGHEEALLEECSSKKAKWRGNETIETIAHLLLLVNPSQKRVKVSLDLGQCREEGKAH